MKAKTYLKLGVLVPAYERDVSLRFELAAAKELGFEVVDGRYGNLEEILSYDPSIGELK